MEYALILVTEPPDPKTRMAAFLKWRYGADYVTMVGFHELSNITDPVSFRYAARAVIWKMPEWEAT